MQMLSNEIVFKIVWMSSLLTNELYKNCPNLIIINKEITILFLKKLYSLVQHQHLIIHSTPVINYLDLIYKLELKLEKKKLIQKWAQFPFEQLRYCTRIKVHYWNKDKDKIVKSKRKMLSNITQKMPWLIEIAGQFEDALESLTDSSVEHISTSYIPHSLEPLNSMPNLSKLVIYNFANFSRFHESIPTIKELELGSMIDYKFLDQFLRVFPNVIKIVCPLTNLPLFDKMPSTIKEIHLGFYNGHSLGHPIPIHLFTCTISRFNSHYTPDTLHSIMNSLSLCSRWILLFGSNAFMILSNKNDFRTNSCISSPPLIQSYYEVTQINNYYLFEDTTGKLKANLSQDEFENNSKLFNQIKQSLSLVD